MWFNLFGKKTELTRQQLLQQRWDNQDTYREYISNSIGQELNERGLTCRAELIDGMELFSKKALVISFKEDVDVDNVKQVYEALLHSITSNYFGALVMETGKKTLYGTT